MGIGQPGKGVVELPVERGHMQWLSGVLGIYTLSRGSYDDPEALRLALPSLTLLRCPEGTEIIREGEQGEDLFLVYSGKVSVSRGGQVVAELGSGSVIGEIGFLTRKPRSATVRAADSAEILRIGSFGRFLDAHPALREFMEDLAGHRLEELQKLARLSTKVDPTPLPPPFVSKPAGAGLLPEPVRRPAPKAARTIAGRYEVQRLIGQGGMGLVFLAHDRSLDRTVAIKQLRDEIAEDPSVRSMFMSEARLVAQLSHPFIVAIHDIVEDGPKMWLVFDYIDGHPLSRFIQEKHRFSVRDCLTVFRFVCQAVAHAHWNKVLHRDLKTSNIMLDRSGYAKVMDFGIARRVKDSLNRLSQKEPCGTPVYMAPEQHLGDCMPASDVYSLAVCLYEMMTGDIPFGGPDFFEQKRRMLFRPVSSVVPGLPSGIDRLFAAGLSPDPERRFQDPIALLKELGRLSGP